MDIQKFPFGVIYGAMLPREEWVNDFQEMRKAGMNTIRFAIGFPGRRGSRAQYWDDIDYVLSLAREHGMQVLLTLGTIVLPRDFFEEYPDIRFIDIDGQPFPRNIEDLTWPQACFNHPGYRREIEAFFQQVIARYKDHPAIYAWTVHNEPCNPWGGTGCYCQHTIEVFRNWLRERYEGRLDEVNRLWATSFRTWDEVQPPHTRPHDGGNASAWMDWMTFGEWNVTDFVRWEAELVKALDPSHPVSTNTMGGMLLPITTAQSEKDLTQVLDFIGQDWYPSWELQRRNGERAQMEKHVGAKLDMTRWATGDKPAIVMEVQAGPNAESIWFRADEMRIEAWQAVAHGLKGIYFYRWDPIISGAEPWVHHMRTIEGEITERVDEAGRLSRQIGAMVDLVAQSMPIQAPVALLYSRPSKIMAEAANLFQPHYWEAVQGVYRLCADNHYPVDWIDDEEVLAGKLAAYSVLLMPFTYCLSERMGEAIKEYVRQGGIVVAEPFCANRDEHGVPYSIAPGAGLVELFGVRVRRVVNYHYWLVGHLLEINAIGHQLSGVKEGAKFWLCGLREEVDVTGEEAQVLAEFSEYPPLQAQTPAIVLNSYGKGKAVYFAAGLGEAYTKMELPYLRQAMNGLLTSLGVAKPVIVEGMSDQASQDLEVMVLDTKDGADRLVFVINHADAPAEGALRIMLGREGCLRARELITFRSVPCVPATDGRVVVDVTVPARDVVAINLYPQASSNGRSTGVPAPGKGKLSTPSILPGGD